MTSQDLMAVYRDTAATMAVLAEGDSLLIFLAVFAVISSIWSVARMSYHWWSGPTGGRFPPDVLATYLFSTAGQYIWAAGKRRMASFSARGTGSAEQQPDRVAQIRAYLCRTKKKKDTDVLEEAEQVETGMPGPAFQASFVSELTDMCKSARLVRPNLDLPSPILADRVEEWMESSAALGAAADPLNSSKSGATEAGGVLEKEYTSTEEGSKTSTFCGDTSNCGSDLDSPTNTKVRVVTFYVVCLAVCIFSKSLKMKILFLTFPHYLFRKVLLVAK